MYIRVLRQKKQTEAFIKSKYFEQGLPRCQKQRMAFAFVVFSNVRVFSIETKDRGLYFATPLFYPHYIRPVHTPPPPYSSRSYPSFFFSNLFIFRCEIFICEITPPSMAAR